MRNERANERKKKAKKVKLWTQEILTPRVWIGEGQQSPIAAKPQTFLCQKCLYKKCLYSVIPEIYGKYRNANVKIPD